MKKTVLLAIVLFLYIQSAFSQENKFFPDYFPVSPQAATFGKYLDLPVDLSTGRINHQIPLYSISEGGVTVPVSLSYNYSGLMADEKSSTTGLGWSLMAGGIITRKVNGKPDEIGYLNGSGQIVYNFVNGNLTNGEISTLITQSGTGSMDTEPDKFFIMANGLSSTFYINHEGNVVFFPDSDLKVEYESYLTSFTVTDTAGNKYVFAAQDSVNTISNTGSTANEDNYTSSWALTEIIPYKTKKPISFEYEINSVVQRSLSKKIDLLQGYPSVSYPACNQMHRSITTTNHITIFDDLVLRKISTHNQTIDFEYRLTNNNRGKVISEIHATNQPSYIFSFQQNSGDQLIHKIEKNSGTLIKPYYELEYEIGDYNPESNKRDYLGYYNSSNNGIINNDGTIETNLNFDSTKSGALKKIINPTGGFSEIQYEQNQISENTLINNSGISVAESTDFGISKGLYQDNSTTFYEKEYFPDDNHVIDDQYDIKLNYSFTSNVAGALGIIHVYADGELISRRHMALELIPAGQQNVTQTFEIDLPDGVISSFKLRIYLELPPAFSNIDYPFISSAAIINFGLKEIVGSSIAGSYPGIRVKETKTCDDQSSNCYKKKFSYLTTTGESSGIAFSQPNFFSHSFNKFYDALHPLDPPSYNCTLKSLSSSSITPVSSYSGSPVLYKEVKETIFSEADEKLGEIHHTYSGRFFPPPIIPYLQSPNFEWENGKELTKKVYSSNNTLKTKDSTEYNRVFNFKSQGDVYAFKSIQTKFQGTGFINSSYFEIGSRIFTKSVFQKKESVSTSYYDDQFLTRTINYLYNNSNYLHPKKTEVIDSKGYVLQSESDYAHDKNDTILINENRITIPLKKVAYKDAAKLSEQNTTYSNFNGLYLPEIIQTSKGSQPLDDRILYHAYDDFGNPLEVSKADGTHIVYIWGYNQTQPIAKIENATYADVQIQVANLQTLSNADNDRTIDTINQNGSITPVGKEGDLRAALTILRASLPESQVTTYTYDPLIGVTSVTDPRGDTVYYEYDDFNRLKHVKDKDGNILSQNEYNYKN